MTRARDIADQQENLGGAVAPFVAGKNKVINGDFSVWQRGTSFSNPLDSTYNADRWQIQHDGTGASRTISQQTFTPGAAPVAGYEGQYFYRFAVTAAGTGNTYQDFRTFMEDVRTFAGQTVTLSFWAKADASRVLSLIYRASYGTGGTSPNQFTVGSVTLTTSWVRYSVTYAVPSLSGLAVGPNSFGAWIFRPPAATVQTIDIWGVQVESGNVATPFTTASGSIQGELALCQRYFTRFTGNAASFYYAVAMCDSATTAYGVYKYPVVMRVTPSFAAGGVATSYGAYNAGGAVICSAFPTISNANPETTVIVNTFSSGLTAGRSVIMFAGSGTTMDFSAEL